MHQKSIAFLNAEGYYSKLFDFFEHMMEAKLLKPEPINQRILENDPVSLL